TKLWRAEHYGSPLEAITREQALGVEQALQATDAHARVHVAYEFRNPLLREVLARIPAHEPVDVVPMYAADSAFTHELSRAAVKRALRGLPRTAPTRVVPALATETLAKLSARLIVRETETRESFGPGWGLVLPAP